MKEGQKSNKKRPLKRKPLCDSNNNSDSEFEPDLASKNKNKLKKKKPSAIFVKDVNESEKDELIWKCPVSKERSTNTRKRLPLTNNILNVLNGFSSGIIQRGVYHRAAVNPVIENVSKFAVSKLVTPFDRRVTALAWHPSRHSLAAAGSKGGDIILWDSSKSDDSSKSRVESMIKGQGPGGSIQSLKFDNIHPDRVYTASIDGTVAKQDFCGKDTKIYLETNDYNFWYTGLDVSFSGRMIVSGNNKGFVTLLSMEGEKIWDLKLHKTKCNFVQFSERQPWMMVTTSTGGGDGSVKVWDIRNISDKNSALNVLPHDKAVNSAYFSPVSGDKLLTTDQHSQLRVYEAPNFTLKKTIPHPHRQFQHLTPIKACWHPLADIPFAGRYPDPQFPGYSEGELRSIDFFCPDTGNSLYNLHQPGLQQIISLSQFNSSGDCLMSGMGSSILLWQARFDNDGDEIEDHPSSTVESNLEGLSVQLWPDFNQKKKKQSKKKQK